MKSLFSLFFGVVFIQMVFVGNLAAMNGDVDGNGSLGLEDCVAILQILSGKRIFDGDGTIQCGDSLTGNIAESEEIDEFTFYGLTGEIIAIAVTSQSTSALFEPRWALYDPSEGLVGNMEFEGNYHRTLTADGLFTIKVWDYQENATGQYNIRLEPVSANLNGLLNCARPIACGETVTSTLEAENAADSFRFHGEEGEVIAIALTNLDISAVFQPRFTLYDTSGNGVGNTEFEGNYARTLPAGGIFTIRVLDHQTDGAGEYSIRLEPVSSTFGGIVNCAQPIAYGSIVSGELESENAADSYRFSGEAGKVVEISVANLSDSALFRPRWTLLDPSGNNVGNTEYEGTYSRTLTADGIFTLRLWDYQLDGIGQYSITLNLSE